MELDSQEQIQTANLDQSFDKVADTREVNLDVYTNSGHHQHQILNSVGVSKDNDLSPLLFTDDCNPFERLAATSVPYTGGPSPATMDIACVQMGTVASLSTFACQDAHQQIIKTENNIETGQELVSSLPKDSSEFEH